MKYSILKKCLMATTAGLLVASLWTIFPKSNTNVFQSLNPLVKSNIMKDSIYTNGSGSRIAVTFPSWKEKTSSVMKIEAGTFKNNVHDHNLKTFSVRTTEVKAPSNTVADIKCVGADKGQSEDLFCLDRPATLSNYRNPCWKDDNQTTRCLPYFYLIGSDKCGSTDLFNRIQQHPDVTQCTCNIGKESWYWSWDRYGLRGKVRRGERKSFSQYIKQFDDAAKVIDETITDGHHNVVVGDGTPMDFWDFRGWTLIPQNKGLSKPRVLTPHLMRHMYGDKKMILIMRNPVDRLYSDYYFLRYGDSPESFHRDAVRSVTMMKDCLESKNTAACFYSEDMYSKLPSRIHLGCYSVFLKEWLSVFPRHNFLFLRTEDYKVNIATTMSDVYTFLGLRPLEASELDHVANLKRKHVTAVKIGAPPMFNITRDILTNFYQEYNNELASILNDERFLWRTK